MNHLALALSISLLTGSCATNSSNMRVGTDQSYTNLKDQREAITTVREYSSMPEGATRVGKVDVARCHRNTMQAKPTDDEVKVDLKVAAYAKGADGIMDIKISKSSGLLLNCWNILNGEATAIMLRK
jgi:hypothetical protein